MRPPRSGRTDASCCRAEQVEFSPPCSKVSPFAIAGFDRMLEAGPRRRAVATGARQGCLVLTTALELGKESPSSTATELLHHLASLFVLLEAAIDRRAG